MTVMTTDRLVTTLLRSHELSCPSCVPKIEKALGALPGVERARVHFNTGRIEVHHDPSLTEPDTLVDTVRRVGYESAISAY